MRRPRVVDARLADATAEQVRRSQGDAVRDLQRGLPLVAAYGRVTGATGALEKSGGVESVLRTATGFWLVALSAPIDPDRRQIVLTVRTVATEGVIADSAIDTPRRFRVYGFNTTTGADADVDFAFTVLRLS